MTTLPNDPGELQLPAPRRAAEEFADLERVRELGIEIDDLDMARTVASVLSRFLARGRSQTRSNLKAMMIALATACSIEVVHDGEVEPPPHPELAAATWPNASSAYSRFDITADTLEAYWREARNHAADACYPCEWLVSFFPPALWRR
jgi:hypothetical protein